MKRDQFSAAALRAGGIFLFAAALVAAPASARAQSSTTDGRSSGAVGERYHIELAATIWNPTPTGIVSSEQFQQIGSDIDFVNDLGYSQTRFKNLQIVGRPGKKHRFRFEYLPLVYNGDTTFKRNIVFNGVLYPVNVPVQSQFSWKVMRLGYEYDFVYKPRGFVGVLFDMRYTKFDTTLTSPIPCAVGAVGGCTQFTNARAPLPALGIVARGYVMPEVALNFEVSGFQLPNIDPKYQANYWDWDIHGTVNLTNNVGIQVGWRKITTFLGIEHDKGDVEFKGMWFGGAIRY